MNSELKNYGLILPDVIEQEEHVLGVLGSQKEVINPHRNWIPYTPPGELQKRTIETSSCTEFGSISGIQTLSKFRYGVSTNHSERELAIRSGNTIVGNNPHVVLENIRKGGLVLEESLPFTDEIKTWDEFMSPDPLPGYLKKERKKWHRQYDLKHEWLWNKNTDLAEKQSKLYESLQYSPCGASVHAWNLRQDGFYIKPAGSFDNHWCLVVDAEWGVHWKVYDSYVDDDFVKELDWNYDFGLAKLLILNKNEIYSPNPFVDFWYGLIWGR